VPLPWASALPETTAAYIYIHADRKRTLAFTPHVTELARIKNTPTDAELATQIDEVESKVRPPPTHPLQSDPRLRPHQTKVAKLREHLEPLRAGTPLVSTTDLDVLDAEWAKWRAEWVRRRKVFYKYARISVSLPPRV
jgi:26S proteasome regulatory subunit, ATPase 3, interacting protein